MRTITPDMMAERILGEMKRRYGDSFTFVNELNSPFMERVITLHASSDRFPGEKVLVTASDFDRNMMPLTVRDNYTAFLFRERAEGVLQELAAEVYGSCKLIYNVFNTPLSAAVTPQMPLEDYMRQPSGFLFSVVAVSEKDDVENAKKAEAFWALLKSNGIRASVTVYHVDDSSVMKDINRHNAVTYYVRDDWYSSSVCFVMDEEMKMNNVEWRKK